jgi:hypothetical protein
LAIKKTTLPPNTTRIIIAVYLFMLAFSFAITAVPSYIKYTVIEERLEKGGRIVQLGSASYFKRYTVKEMEVLAGKLTAQEALVGILVAVAFALAFTAIAVPFFVGGWRRDLAIVIRSAGVLAVIAYFLARHTLYLEGSLEVMTWTAVPVTASILLFFELLARAVKLVGSQKPDRRLMPLTVGWAPLKKYIFGLMFLVLIAGTLGSFYCGSIGFGERRSSWGFGGYISPSMKAGSVYLAIHLVFFLTGILIFLYKGAPRYMWKFFLLYIVACLAAASRSLHMHVAASFPPDLVVIPVYLFVVFMYLSPLIASMWLLRRARLGIKG